MKLTIEEIQEASGIASTKYTAVLSEAEAASLRGQLEEPSSSVCIDWEAMTACDQVATTLQTDGGKIVTIEGEAKYIVSGHPSFNAGYTGDPADEVDAEIEYEYNHSESELMLYFDGYEFEIE